MNQTLTPPPASSPEKAKNIRLTITVTPEVHEAFSQLAQAQSMSLGRTMGEWLFDTLDAVKHVASMVQHARDAPGLMAKQLHAYAQGMQIETQSLIDRVREDSSQARRTAAQAQPGQPLGAPKATLTPPYVIRGVTSPKPQKKQHKGRDHG